MDNKRFDRNIRFFGLEGQERLQKAHVAVVGVGGLGTHVVQQLALYGVGRLTLIDHEELDVTNTNRYIGFYHDDPIPGTLKVHLGKRLVNKINPGVPVEDIPHPLVSKESFNAIIRADYVFGCLDNEGARMILNKLCSAYTKPYIDLATDIFPGKLPSYGGRIYISWDGKGCLVCHDQLDMTEAQRDLASPEERATRKALYGVEQELLGEKGPSVVSINGVIASLGVTEFMLWVTGVRLPQRLTTYRGQTGRVAVSTDDPAPDCYYCKGVRGKEEAANIQIYLSTNQSS